jgi:polysaccharide export outer membrane protein
MSLRASLFGVLLLATGLWAGTASLADSPGTSGTPDPAYRLAPKDVVEIKVYREPDLETRAPIAENGKLTLPLLGPVPIAGKSIEEARLLIQELLDKDYLVAPQVSLKIVEYGRRQFTILGEVQRPATYEIPPNETVNVLQAVAMAGGFTKLAAAGKVVVQRIERGQKKVYRLDTTAMAEGNKLELFQILPGDIITVRERFL